MPATETEPVEGLTPTTWRYAEARFLVQEEEAKSMAPTVRSFGSYAAAAKAENAKEETRNLSGFIFSFT